MVKEVFMRKSWGITCVAGEKEQIWVIRNSYTTFTTNIDQKYRIFSGHYHYERTKMRFGDFSPFPSLPHSKDKDFANAPDTSHGVKIAPHYDRGVLRSYTCDVNLGISYLTEAAWYVVFGSATHLCLMKANLKTPTEEITWNGDSSLERNTKCVQQVCNQDPPWDKMKELCLASVAYYNWKIRSKRKLLKEWSPRLLSKLIQTRWTRDTWMILT